MARTNRRAAGETARNKPIGGKPRAVKSAARVDFKDEAFSRAPSPGEIAGALAAAEGAIRRTSETRREDNRRRFIRVVYGNTGPEGRQTGGRLSKLVKAFEFLAQTTDRDHYEFTQSQGAAVLNAVEIEMQKLRQVIQANAKPDPPRFSH